MRLFFILLLISLLASCGVEKSISLEESTTVIDTTYAEDPWSVEKKVWINGPDSSYWEYYTDWREPRSKPFVKEVLDWVLPYEADGVKHIRYEMTYEDVDIDTIPTDHIARFDTLKPYWTDKYSIEDCIIVVKLKK